MFVQSWFSPWNTDIALGAAKNKVAGGLQVPPVPPRRYDEKVAAYRARGAKPKPKPKPKAKAKAAAKKSKCAALHALE